MKTKDIVYCLLVLVTGGITAVAFLFNTFVTQRELDRLELYELREVVSGLQDAAGRQYE